MFDCFVRKKLNFLDHARSLLLVLLFSELLEIVVTRVLVSSEKGKKERELSLFEEFVLRSLTVEVHWVAYNFVGHRRIQKESVRLGVSMTEEQHFQHV
jgi:hypothetical protein